MDLKMDIINTTVAIYEVTGEIDDSLFIIQQLIRCSLFLLAVTLLIRAGYIKPAPKNGKLPPGPPRIPFLGNLHLLMKNRAQPYKTITNLAKQYGPVMRFKFGAEEAVIISDYEILKEAFVRDAEFNSERPEIILRWEEEKGGQEGRHSQEKLWREIHKTNESILHRAVIKKTPFEHRFVADLELLLEALGAEKGEFDPSMILTKCVSSISWHFCSGQRLHYDDPRLDQLVELVFRNLTDMKSAIVQSYLHVPQWMQTIFTRQMMVPVFNRMYDIIRDVISDHTNDLSGGAPNDVVGAMLDMKRRNGGHHELFTDNGMLRTMHSFMLGGVDSMQSVLRWLFLYFLHFPEIQERCYNDVIENIGDSREPNAADCTNLKYITATIYEVLRHGNIAPLGVPHSSKADVKIGGYTIPSNTLLFTNQYAVHRDPNLWHKPDDFLPERWLDESGNVRKHEGFIPFSIGPRHCPGEKHAKLQLVMLTAGILQHYKIMPSVNMPVPDLEGVQVLSAAPKPFAVCIERR